MEPRPNQRPEARSHPCRAFPELSGSGPRCPRGAEGFDPILVALLARVCNLPAPLLATKDGRHFNLIILKSIPSRAGRCKGFGGMRWLSEISLPKATSSGCCMHCFWKCMHGGSQCLWSKGFMEKSCKRRQHIDIVRNSCTELASWGLLDQVIQDWPEGRSIQASRSLAFARFLEAWVWVLQGGSRFAISAHHGRRVAGTHALVLVYVAALRKAPRPSCFGILSALPACICRRAC